MNANLQHELPTIVRAYRTTRKTKQQNTVADQTVVISWFDADGLV